MARVGVSITDLLRVDPVITLFAGLLPVEADQAALPLTPSIHRTPPFPLER